MKAPRLALLALWALLTPSFAAAGETWGVLRPGDDWKAVAFTEDGKTKQYWFRADATGGDIPLYDLTLKKKGSVAGDAYEYESAAAPYKLKVIPAGTELSRAQGQQQPSYVIARSGTSPELAGEVRGTLGAAAWDTDHPAAYKTRTLMNRKISERANPYVPGSVLVVVKAPVYAPPPAPAKTAAVAAAPVAANKTSDNPKRNTKPVTASPKEPGNLTSDEKKRLEPEELKKYEVQLKEASAAGASAQTKDALRQMNAALRASIKKRKPYVEPTDAASFENLEVWGKKRFCEGLPAPGAVIAPDKNNDLVGTGKGAKEDLEKSAATSAATPPPTTGNTGKTWTKDEADDACKKLKNQLALGPNQTPAGPNKGNVAVVPPLGPGTDPAAGKPNPWLSKDLLISGAKGAMVGLLIGSLFGPVGLVAGPLLGAALFYGLTKING